MIAALFLLGLFGIVPTAPRKPKRKNGVILDVTEDTARIALIKNGRGELFISNRQTSFEGIYMMGMNLRDIFRRGDELVVCGANDQNVVTHCFWGKQRNLLEDVFPVTVSHSTPFLRDSAMTVFNSRKGVSVTCPASMVDWIENDVFDNRPFLTFVPALTTGLIRVYYRGSKAECMALRLFEPEKVVDCRLSQLGNHVSATSSTNLTTMSIPRQVLIDCGYPCPNLGNNVYDNLLSAGYVVPSYPSDPTDATYADLNDSTFVEIFLKDLDIVPGDGNEYDSQYRKFYVDDDHWWDMDDDQTCWESCTIDMSTCGS